MATQRKPTTHQHSTGKAPIQTLEITNFGGRLSRIKMGSLNSGFAKFTSSFGYDPFTKPGQLTWFETPVDITGGMTDLIVAMMPRYEGTSSQQFVYAVGNQGKFYKITPNSATNPNVDTSSLIGLVANSAAFNFGGSITFKDSASPTTAYIGNDTQVNRISTDGSGDAVVGSAGDYNASVFRPLQKFLGYVAFGNKTNIGLIDSTNTVISSVVAGKYQQLNPSLPPDVFVTDMDVSPDGNYLLITTSGVPNEQIGTITGDRQSASASNGNVFKWNGVDAAVTAATQIPSFAVTALQTALDKSMFFSNDTFGASLSDGATKLLTMPNNKSPFSNTTLMNGNFISWISPEVAPDNSTIYASMYYYGNLDTENPKGLYRMFRYATALANGFVYNVPTNILTNNKFSTVNNSVSSVVTMGYGKHYFSTYEVNPGHSATDKLTLQRFIVTSTGTGTPQAGVYETQNELFSKRISIAEIRIYCEPTVTGNGYQLDVIGSDGNPVANGTFTYTFGLVDPTFNTTALERINHNTNMKDLYSFGIRITNTGTTNMIISKIEVDWSYSGK